MMPTLSADKKGAPPPSLLDFAPRARAQDAPASLLDFAHQARRGDEASSPPIESLLLTSQHNGSSRGHHASSRYGAAPAPARAQSASQLAEMAPNKITSAIMKSVSLRALCSLLASERDIESLNTIHVAATLGHIGKLSRTAVSDRQEFPSDFPLLLQRMSAKAKGMAREFEPRHLANIIHTLAFSHLLESRDPYGPCSRDLFEYFYSEIGSRAANLDSFKGQDITVILYGVARAGFMSNLGDWPDLALDHLMRNELKNLDAYSISNLIWSLARLKRNDEAFLRAMCAEVVTRGLGAFEPMHVSNLMWGLAELGYYDGAIVGVLARHVEALNLSKFNAQNLTYMLRALMLLRVHLPWLCSSIVDEIAQKDLASFKASDLANCAWSISMLAVDSTAPLLSAMAHDLARRPLHGVDGATIASATWAFACADLLGDVNVVAWLNRNDDFRMDQSNMVLARQLFEVLCAWRLEHDQETIELPPLLRRVATWVDPLMEARRSEVSSPGHLAVVRDVAEAFKSLACECEIDVFVPSGLHVDISVTTPGARKIGIEVDDPNQFLRDGTTPMGNALFKRRLLAKSFWGVASICAAEWNVLSSEDRIATVKGLVV